MVKLTQFFVFLIFRFFGKNKQQKISGIKFWLKLGQIGHFLSYSLIAFPHRLGTKKFLEVPKSGLSEVDLAYPTS